MPADVIRQIEEAGDDGDPDADAGFDGLRHDNFRRYHDNCKEDPGERGRRIWERWRHWINTTNPCPQITTALSLIAINQTSSASMERVFSQLNYIDRVVVGRQGLEDLTELRCMFRCNNTLLDQHYGE